jgi:hypothetical protein
MKFEKGKCPKCGEPVRGTMDLIPGIAWVSELDADGCQEYEGETEMDWDGQRTRTHGGKLMVICSNYHTWFTKAEL